MPAPSPTISTVPCPGTPQLLWSRTLSVEANFRGAADADGNLYWTEYDPSTDYPLPATAGWLVSASSDGRVRYRVRAPAASFEGAFLVVGGRVVMSRGAVLAAHDAATGAPVWTLDLSATYRPYYSSLPGVSGIADMGNGTLAMAFYEYDYPGPGKSGLYTVDAASGRIVWSDVQPGTASYRVEGSDGTGTALATAWPKNTMAPLWRTDADVRVMDNAGGMVWSTRVEGWGFLAAWPAGPPILHLAGATEMASRSGYRVLPEGWFATVMGNDVAFAIDYGMNPVGVHILRGGAVVAEGALPAADPRVGVATVPFLAGDHLVLLTQLEHGCPCLCHGTSYGAASLWRFDTSTSWQCPFTFQGESAIEGAALLPGQLVIGRRTYFSAACTHDLHPVTIEAYALPGESLAPAGWVQRGGSPGLGMRPIVH